MHPAQGFGGKRTTQPVDGDGHVNATLRRENSLRSHGWAGRDPRQDHDYREPVHDQLFGKPAEILMRRKGSAAEEVS